MGAWPHALMDLMLDSFKNSFVEKFLKDNNLEAQSNAIDIVLISTKANATRMIEFRCISLCNICYKIMSKLLVEQNRPLFLKFILENKGPSC